MMPWPPKPPSLTSNRSLRSRSRAVPCLLAMSIPPLAGRRRLLRLRNQPLVQQVGEGGALLLDELPDPDRLAQGRVERLQRREVLHRRVLTVVAQLVDRLPEPVPTAVVDGAGGDDLDEGEALVQQRLHHRAAQPPEGEDGPAGDVGRAGGGRQEGQVE